MIQLIAYVIFTAMILIIAKKYLDRKGHPKGLFYLFFAEMWERFSFYGMRALLTLYLIKDYYNHLENNEEIAYGIYAAYGSLVYLTPLIGGYIADRFLGYRKAILFGGALMALGHFFMAFPSDTFFYGALGLLIMGNGFFKPNISTLVGSLYKEGDMKRDGGFTIFYMGINLGAMIAPLFCGYLGEVYGWHYGFGAAGIGMLAGLLVFWKGINANVLEDKGLQPIEYVKKKIAGLSVSRFIYVLGFLAVPVFASLIVLDIEAKLLKNVLVVVGLLVLSYVAYIIYDLKVTQKDKASGDRLIAIMILCVFLTVFWACFEIAGSAVTVWVDKCVNLVGMNASQTNAINPAYIVLLAIPFSWLWTKLGAMKKNPNTPMKFALGILQLGLGFLIFACTIHFIGDNGKVPFLFVFLGYFLITTGELFLSPIGLSKVTQLSPKRIVAFMMGVWFLSSTFAHYISGGIAKITTKEFYNEVSLFTINDGEHQNTYVFDLKFDYKNNPRNIKKIKDWDLLEKRGYAPPKKSVDSVYYAENLFTKQDKREIAKLINYELVNNQDDFWWEINEDGLLVLSLKSEKDKINTQKEDDLKYLEQIKQSFSSGEMIENKVENNSIIERIAAIFPWEFLNNGEADTNIIEEFFVPEFETLRDNPSLISIIYKTNESIKGNKDAIAGVNYLSKKNTEITWKLNENSNLKHQEKLNPGVYINDLSIENKIILRNYFQIKEGPSDVLSKITYRFLGQPKIKNKSIATLLQYNNVYTKIGIVTIFIAIFVISISRFIKKLMHGIH